MTLAATDPPDPPKPPDAPPTPPAAPDLAELEPHEARAAELEQRLAEHVERGLQRLPAEQRRVIEARAGEDVQKRYELLELALEVGPGQPAAPAGPATLAQALAAAPLVTTAPPAGAPRPTKVLTAFQQYERLQRAGEAMQATIFYKVNARAIEASRPAGE